MDSRGSPVTPKTSVVNNFSAILRAVLLLWPAGLLSIAAGMKARVLLSSGPHPSLNLLSWALIAAEVFLAAWLFSGVEFRSARRVGIVVSIGFALVVLAKLAFGEYSCGCFGDLDVPPAAAFFIDLSLIGCLWYGDDKTLQILGRNKIAACISATSISLALMFAASSTPIYQCMSRVVTLFARGSKYVDVSTWVGKQFPLVLDVSSDIDFAHGCWTAVLYQDSCAKCQELIRGITEGQKSRTLFIEFPPFSNEGRVDVRDGHRVRFRNDQRWFIPLPQVIQINDGVVQQIRRSPLSVRVEN